MFDEDVILLQVDTVAIGVTFLDCDDYARAGGDNRSADRHSDVNTVKSNASIPRQDIKRSGLRRVSTTSLLAALFVPAFLSLAGRKS